MKDLFIKNLSPGEHIDAHVFVVQKFKESTTKTGKTYLDITFADKTGEIKAKVWENALQMCDTVGEGDVVCVSAEVGEYNGSAQLVVQEMRLTNDFDPADFIQTSQHDDDDQFNKLIGIIKKFENKYLKKLLESILIKDDDLAIQFKRAFGAEKAHHAFLGGLMEHTLEMISFIEPVAQAYPEINRELLIAGVILHDIGKMVELQIDMKVSRTRQGHLWGHIIQGIELVTRKIETIKDFPQELQDQVVHLIVSHHGKLEFGSPIKPMTIEAVALNYIDMLSSKLNMIRNLRSQPRNKHGFTEYSYLLEGRFYFNDDSDESGCVVDGDLNDLENMPHVVANGEPQEKDQLKRNLQIPF